MSTLHHIITRINASAAFDITLFIIVLAAMLMNLLWALAAAQGWNLFFSSVKKTDDTLAFPSNPQVLRLSLIFVPLGILLAHQHSAPWARWQTSSHLNWLWLLVSLIWILVPLLAWPGDLVLDDHGIRQPALLPPRPVYIPLRRDRRGLRWRQLCIIIVGKSGKRIIHTQSHAARNLFRRRDPRPHRRQNHRPPLGRLTTNALHKK